MNKNLIVSISFFFALMAVASFSAPRVLADWLIDSSGTLFEYDEQVLGDDDVDSSVSPRPEITPERKREEQKDVREKARETAKQNLVRKIERNNRTNKDIENEFEIATKNGELKIKQKTKLLNGTEKETEFELKKDETLHIDQGDDDAVLIDAARPGELEITKNNLKGHTRLPLSVNENNELMVTRPDGSVKIVTVLPDVAIAKMTERGLFVGSASGESPTPENVELTTNEDGDPVYSHKQEVRKKVLGLIPMKFGSETSVSATDSEVVTTGSTETKFWRVLLERLAL